MKKQKQEKKTRCSGTMSEPVYLAFIRSCLRSKWLRWKPRSDCFIAARRACKNKGRQKFEYQCAICTNWFAQKECEIDHYPKSAGSILSIQDVGEFCNNLFCEVDNLRVVCKPCHSIYTLSEKQSVSFEQAKLIKEAITFSKLPVATQLSKLKELGIWDKSITNADKRRQCYQQWLERNNEDKYL